MNTKERIALLRRMSRYTAAEVRQAKRLNLPIRVEVFTRQLKDVIGWILELESKGADV